MTKNTFFATIFFIAVVFVACWQYWALLYWKILRLRTKEQTFDLLAKYRFIEITGPSGKGKSWLLMHLFKQLEGVKFTNCPTPKSLYTLNKEDLEIHMIGKWDAPNKWFYFLDDIDTFQKWSQQEFGKNGYSALTDYISQAGKLGGVFIWTSNGAEIDSVFKTNKNKSWKVLGYTSFLKKSLLWVQANDSWYNLIPTAIPIDNEEIKGFYDPHWNIRKTYHENFLSYIFNDKLKSEEGAEILRVIKECGMSSTEEEWLKQIKFDRNLLLNYLKAQKKKEIIVRNQKQKFTKVKEDIQRYGLEGKEPTFADIDKWDKEDKRNKKYKKSQIKVGEVNQESDLDQQNQEANLESETNEPKIKAKATKKSQK